MIKIGQPRLEANGENFTRLVSDIWVDGEKRTVWAEVENKYKEYLCYERSDAFVLGLLHYAMTHKHDIECEAPMGEALYYQVTTYLIDAVSKGSHGNLHHVQITADVDSSNLPCANKVGTGISCGVDSLHVLAHLAPTLKNHQITHLAFNNVGSNGEGERAQQLFAARRQMAENFCKEYGYELTSVDSNIMDEFEQSHFMTCIYTCCFSIYVLQKLYSKYYIASSEPVFHFNLEDNHLRDASFYEGLFVSVCSVENLKIYCEGMTLTRLEKVEDISKYAPSYKYLNVCTSTAKNCNKCEKCMRTLLALDILGILDLYRSVFDVDYYLANKQDYLRRMYIEYKVKKNTEYDEIYPYFKNQVTLVSRLKTIPVFIVYWCQHSIKNMALRQFAKKVYHQFK